MIVPGRTAIYAATVAAPLLVGAVVLPALRPAVLVGDLILLAAICWQGASLRRLRVIVERESWTRVEIDCPVRLRYRIENVGRRRVRVGLRQVWPASFESTERRVDVTVAPSEVVRVDLEVVPRRRGRVTIAPAEVDVRYGLELARRRDLLDATTVTVYPSLRLVAHYDVLRRHRALNQFGIHRMRRVGSGREFDQLRDYLPDDDYRDVNWKATARRREPITNVYQTERSQEVLLCLDSGRMMGNPVGRGTALDQAIDASIVLAHVCHRSGDRVGMAVFGDTVQQFVRPASGESALRRMIDQLIEIEAEGVFPSYTALVSRIRALQKKRSLIFLFTDLNDPQLAANLAEVLPLISRRHVLVVVSLRDPLLDRIAAGAASDARSLHQVFAARELSRERAARVRELILAGVQVLEADADRLSLDVINRYLQVKARQMV